MKILTILFGVFAAAWSQSCYSGVSMGCAGGRGAAVDLSSCTVSVGGGNEALMKRLEDHVAYQIRAIPSVENGLGIGFQRLFRNLSDSAWENAIDTMKEMTKRGGSWSTEALSRVNFTRSFPDSGEILSLASALDMHKELISQLHRIHAEAQNGKGEVVDTVQYGIPTYLDTSMFPRISSNIRTLGGYLAEVHRMLSLEGLAELSINLFDEYLQSVY